MIFFGNNKVSTAARKYIATAFFCAALFLSGNSAQAAITYQSSGAIAYSSNGGASVSPAYPASIASGNLLVLIIGMKPSSANSGSVTTPAGWTPITSLTGAGGYGTTLGADQGNTNIFTFYKVAAGTESGTLAVTIATNNVSWGQISRFSDSVGLWDVVGTTGSDVTGNATVSITMSVDPGVTAGDYIIGGMTIPTDVTTPNQFSAEALSQTGITFGTVSEISEPDTNTGNDIGGVTYAAPVSAGTSSAAPTFTATAGGTVTNVRGPGVFIRIREPITTIGTGSDPAVSTIAPGAAATDVDQFILQTNTGTETISSVTVNLSTNSGVGTLAITDNSNNVLGSTASPATGSNVISVSGMSAGTSATTFKVRVTPLSHALMPAVPGGAYAITAPVTAWAGSHLHTGSDTNANALTIDNASPANVTSATGSAGNAQVALSWTNPVDSDFHSVVVLRRASNAVADVPAEGSTYIVGNTIGTATVACVVATPTATCTDTGVVNGTAYHYKIFSRDTNENYSAGVVPTGSPFTPAGPPDTTAPSAIANLAATSTTQTTVGLSWTSPGDDGSIGTATSYDLRYSTANLTEGNWAAATQVTGEPTPLIAGSTQSMTVTGLTANTLYYFAIKTSDEVPNISTLSNVVSTSTRPLPDMTAPAAVSNLAASNATQNSIDLAWTSPGDDGSTGTATSYDIRYSTSTINDGNWAAATQVTGEPTPLTAGTNQSMTVTGLTAGTTYYFAIKTSDEVPNTSVLSNVTNLTTLPTADTIAPAAVTNLTASNPTGTTINLAWTSPGDDNNSGTATSYDVRYSTSTITEGNWAAATQVTGEPTPLTAGTNQSMTVTGLSELTTYYFAMKTSDEAPNTSTLSNIASSTTLAIPDTTAPAAIADLSTSGATQTTINLNWTAPGDDNNSGTATSYDIRYSTALITDGNWAAATQVTGEPTPQVAGTAQSMTITGLTNSTTYFFAMKTSDEVPNTSALSNVASGATQAPSGDTTAPSAIANLAASNATDNSIHLTWTAPGDDNNIGTATYYDIRYSLSSITAGNFDSATQVAGEPAPQVAGTSQSMTVTGLTAGTTYYFAMKTADEVPNTSAISNIVSLATTGTAEVPNLTIPGVGGVAPTQVTLSGFAYPNAKIVASQKSDVDVLYKNIPLRNFSIDDNGAFSVSLTALLQGVYILILTAQDDSGAESGILSYSPDLLSESAFNVQNALFSPTVRLARNSVAQNENLQISGAAYPQSRVEIDVDGIIIGEATTTDAGVYSYDLALQKYAIGNHRVRARQTVAEQTSNYSPARTFRISQLLYPRADMNNDDRVNILDWSIFLYRWGSVDQLLRSRLDINGDGKVDIADFSVFLKLLAL